MYRGKIVSSQDEAVRLAQKWLERENKDGVRWIDTTDQPQRYGYSHEPVEKKTPAQLDAEIAETLAEMRHGQTRGEVQADIMRLKAEIETLRQGQDTADKRDRRQELIVRLGDRQADLKDLNIAHRRLLSETLGKAPS